jgi:hypothetical protein
VVESQVTAADLRYMFGVDFRGNLNPLLEGLSRRGQKNYNYLALYFRNIKASLWCDSKDNEKRGKHHTVPRPI